jgi:hypothetical protein
MRASCLRLIATGLLLTISAFAQQKVTRYTPIAKSQVPSEVIKAFKTAYPRASVRGYAKVEIDGTPFYKVETVDGDTHRKISYTPDGSVAKLEERITVSELPAEALQVTEGKYPEAKITSARRVTQGEKISYEVSVKKSGKAFELEFDAGGKLTSEREVKIKIVTY